MSTEAPAGAKPTIRFSELPIPDEWKHEPTIKLGSKEKEYAIAPMSGRNIAKFTAQAVGLKTGAEMAKGNVIDNIEQLYRVVHFGLLRAYPEVTFDEFFDSDARPEQLQDAFEVVAKAAGMEFKKVASPGEAVAASSAESSSSTNGTTS